jgi:hypothetical protein
VARARIITEKEKSMWMRYLRYDPDLGQFFWTGFDNHGSRPTGSRAGHVSPNGYRILTVRQCKLPEHRAAFMFMGLKIPEVVDHRNRDRSDNRWSNLRASNHTFNNLNKINSVCVIKNKHTGRWTMKFTASLDSEEEAIRAWHGIAKQYYGDEIYNEWIGG